MGAEPIIGYIPKFVMPANFGTGYFSIFITPKRVVFIRIGKDYSTGVFYLLGAVGFIIGKAFDYENSPAFRNINLDSLLSENEDNREVLIDRITKIKMKKAFGGDYRLYIYGYGLHDVKKLLFEGLFEVPKEDLERNRRQGYKKQVILKHYVAECQKQIQRCLGDKLVETVKPKHLK